MVEAFVHEVRARNEARTGDEALPDRDPRDESLPDVVAENVHRPIPSRKPITSRAYIYIC